MPKHILIIYVLVACCILVIMVNSFVKNRLNKKAEDRRILKPVNRS
ncbi:hypothetical protein ACRQ5D_19230 [Mucilaginibacter sp. P25]|uniref:CcmD family protein n=1 Tax=Mucilaginibacter rubeus TaxID=2027860 RepID=A0ABX7UJ42_9SPHI|nr:MULTISPECIES: hypothetical protein [Mucilaginibacter]NVM62775.1 hypothetical protein [Mucilaginibacter sp. SG538B]QTE37756.1 hypothetical protein J3L18_01425 [Mucilaginibacter gossypii]QTE46245.1 hypothetical protein J3L19_13105 [Mucilaginibacter rubeus]QTE52842.1 hypothetical protein J3L21_13080 [Mucilaginibacter rubeus]QTE57929.1 hypothetical protein J3L23_04755 [Mucilaginibacter rubeus]